MKWNQCEDALFPLGSIFRFLFRFTASVSFFPDRKSYVSRYLLWSMKELDLQLEAWAQAKLRRNGLGGELER